MGAEVLQALAAATLMSTLSLLVMALLRRPVRALVGARTAYWLWLIVPVATLAVLLPAPSRVLLPATLVLPAQMQAVLTVGVVDAAPDRAPWIVWALSAWLLGAIAMFLLLMRRQQLFVRSLGALSPSQEGWFYSDTIRAPLLLGAWSPRIVVPRDFAIRYTPEERRLVLAHEFAHIGRRDIAVNALASLSLCLSWFNPLMYRALAWLRMDQELACDASVLSQRGDERQAYANALLKTQLATESAWRLPIGCHWQSVHPLTERILMLKRTQPGNTRRLLGTAVIVGLAGGAGFAAWAGSTTRAQGPSILVDLKVTISNTQTHELHVLATKYLVHSGEEIVDANARPLDYSCTPFLPDEADRTTDWKAVKDSAIPVPAAGQILMICKIRQDGQVVVSPAVIAGDGKWATIETAERAGPSRYKIELNATVQKEGRER